MQIIVKSRHTVIPPRLRAKATEKFERLGKLLDKIQTVEVAVGEEKNPRMGDMKNHIEVTLTTKQRRLHAESYGPDVLSAIDGALAKIEAQVRKVKGKALARTRRSGGHAEADREAAQKALNGSPPLVKATGSKRS